MPHQSKGRQSVFFRKLLSRGDIHRTISVAMVDVFLVLVTVVAFVILFVISFYLLVYYQHPDDKNDAYFPKAVVIFGFVVAGATTLLLPLDVANNEGYAGT